MDGEELVLSDTIRTIRISFATNLVRGGMTSCYSVRDKCSTTTASVT